jgi:hypothetical protein
MSLGVTEYHILLSNGLNFLDFAYSSKNFLCSDFVVSEKQIKMILPQIQLLTFRRKALLLPPNELGKEVRQGFNV